jgi:hypothetical protein
MWGAQPKRSLGLCLRDLSEAQASSVGTNENDEVILKAQRYAAEPHSYVPTTQLEGIFL